MLRQVLWSYFFLLLILNSAAQSPNDKIKLNQIGFYPMASKIAIVTAGSADNFRGEFSHKRYCV